MGKREKIFNCELFRDMSSIPRAWHSAFHSLNDRRRNEWLNLTVFIIVILFVCVFEYKEVTYIDDENKATLTILLVDLGP